MDLREHKDLAPLAELSAAIRRAAPDRKALLIGAMARDVMLFYAHGVRAARATEDMDFAFAVEHWQDYAALRGRLLESGEFNEVPHLPHQLIFRGSRKLDLIPFGGVERTDRTIAWPPREEIEMQTIGYREAMANAIRVELTGGEWVLVASLPALVVLKLFAWRDRRQDQPGKDASDFQLILTRYLEAGNRDRLYTEAVQLLEADDYDDARAGAWMLGADVGWLLKAGEDGYALNAVSELVATEVDPDGAVRLARDMKGMAPEYALALLTAFHAGLAGRDKP